MKGTVVEIHRNCISVRPEGTSTIETCTVAPDNISDITRNGKKAILKDIQEHDKVEFDISEMVVTITATGEDAKDKKKRLKRPMWQNGRWFEK